MFGWIRELRRLRADNAVMRAALVWYAAEDNWRRRATHVRGAPKKHWRKSPAAFDRGRLACRALAEIDDARGPQREPGTSEAGSEPATPPPAGV